MYIPGPYRPNSTNLVSLEQQQLRFVSVGGGAAVGLITTVNCGQGISQLFYSRVREALNMFSLENMI